MIVSIRPKVIGAPEDSRGRYERRARVALRAARRRSGLSQLHLALRVGCSPSSVEDYETGKARVPAWILYAAEDLSSRKVGG